MIFYHNLEGLGELIGLVMKSNQIFNGFAFILSASGLSDERYYRLVMDGVQKGCLESGVYPCVLDASIFSSYDEEWPEEYELW